MSKSSIFLSHATPENNTFVRWLGGKLSLAGYEVWFDLERLKGGDIFWDKIEKAIRDDACKFIAVVSEIAHGKHGTRNEWELAATLERKNPGFVIPIRIDRFDFERLPITMHRKAAIDFSRGWHQGLAELLDALEAGKVPRIADADPVMARQWQIGERDGAILLTNTPEVLESNWFPILKLPVSVESARILGSARKIAVTEENRKLPWFELGDRIVGFASTSELISLLAKSVALKAAGAVETISFINEGTSWGENQVAARDARYRVSHLIRQAWELGMEKAGLASLELSWGRRIYYVPRGLIAGDRYPFTDSDGKTRRRSLTGRSERRNVNWHYAVSIHPALDEPRRIELRAHIVFTGDDGLPLESAARAHRLRRGFCRNWWNDRWRGFMRAFMAYLAKGERQVRLSVGEERYIEIGADALEFRSPVRLTDGPAPIDEPTIPDADDEDSWDDDDGDGDADGEREASG